MNRRRLLRAGTLAFASSIAGCTFREGERGPEITESVSKRYPVDAGTRVDVLDRHGSITVTPVSGEEVVVEATKRTRQGRDALDRIGIEADRSGEVLIVQAAHPDVDLLEQPRVAVDFSVGLPEGAVAGAFETADGDVTVEGVTGDARLASTNGNVEARDVDGYVSLGTSNGRVTTTGTSGVERAVTSNGSVDVELRSVRGPVTVETTNGSVTLGAVTSLRATFDLRTSSGSVSVIGLTLERTTDDERHVVGSLNGGGDRVTARTNNGSVRLQALE